MNKKIKIITLCDAHVKHEDPRAIDASFQVCKKLQPDIIILHEWHDFYDLSKFDKNPNRSTDENLQGEIDTVFKYFKRLRTLCPRSRIILLNSNHLERLRKYMWHQSPAVSPLRALEIQSLLRLKELNIEFMENFVYKKVMFKHGDVVRKFAGYTAKGEFEKEGMSGCSGHTHRLSTYYTRLRGGFYVWVESGCLCKLDPQYINGVANWTQGFSIFTFDKKGNHFVAQVIPIIDGRCDYGDKSFNAK